MKSEPESYSIQNLKRDKKTLWEGVRNYQARNFMTQDMQVGDSVLFYHSNADPAGIAGLAKVSGLAVPDPSQFDKKSDFYDAKATPAKPIWFCVQIAFEREFSELLPLEEIKKEPKLSDMLLLRRGQRLSIQPVTEAEYKKILAMEKTKESRK